MTSTVRESFVHLHVHSPFSFLDGATAIDELVQRAAELHMPALALTDHDNVSGAVRFVQACDQAGIKPIIGCELTLEGEHHVTVLTTSPRGYANLCRILTAAHLKNERGRPRASWEHIVRHREDLLFLSGCARGEIPALLHQRRYEEAERAARRYVDALGRNQFFLELNATELPGQHAVNQALVELAERIGVSAVATGNVHYARREQHPIHDVLRCIAAGISVEKPHPHRPFNDQLHMISPADMRRRFAWYPRALDNTMAIAERCQPALILGRPRHPRFTPSPSQSEHIERWMGDSADALLHRLTWAGARRRYGHITPALRRRIDEELAIIGHLAMADYFLVAWDVVEFARKQNIRASGRGSAADSVVAYCLGLTNVDAFKRGLSFERFLSIERGEPPDIDIDFEAHRRDEVAAYVYERYGKDHVSAVATYHTYHARGAIREVGKVLGLSSEEIDAVAKRMPHVPADAIRRSLRHYPELRPVAQELARDTLRRRWFELAQALAGLPRHLGTHSSGLVISADPLMDITPLQMSAKGVPISQFDKDDVEALGLMKLDLLFLRVLGAVNTSTAAVRRRDPTFDYDDIPGEDPRTYERLRRGDTIGAFQLESPAQRALHPRLRPSTFEDIVASVALIRPGPIKGDMVNPFIARRNREEPITYEHPKLRPILEKTYGIVLFQEQIIEIARSLAGFTPGEADRLRRAMSSFRSQAEMDRIGKQFVAKAIAHGCEPDVARKVFSYIAGYVGYGFCEAHAASFADIAYKTTYLLEHHPAEFYAALLSHQPMGYYPSNTLLWEAKRRGVSVRGLCINRSEPEFTVEHGRADRTDLEPRRGRGANGVAKGVQADNLRSTGEPVSEVVAENVGEGVGEAVDAALRGPVSKVVAENVDEVVAIRIGLGQVRALSKATLDAIIAARADGPFTSLTDFCRRVVPLTSEEAEQLVLAGAFDSLNENRRALLWQLPDALRLGRQARERQQRWDMAAGESATADVEDFSDLEKDLREYRALGLTARRHLLHHWRPQLRRRGARPCAEASRLPHGHPVTVGGLCIRPHRPPTKSGRTVVFLTLEDETGLIDVTIFEDVYMRWGEDLFVKPLLLVTGRVEYRGDAVSITAQRVRAIG